MSRTIEKTGENGGERKIPDVGVYVRQSIRILRGKKVRDSAHEEYLEDSLTSIDRSRHTYNPRRKERNVLVAFPAVLG